MPKGSLLRPQAFGRWILSIVAVVFSFICLAPSFALAAIEPPSEPSLAQAKSEPSAFNYCVQGHAPETRLVVVDKSRQRLMVLRYVGQLVLEYEFPCATGSQPGTKTAEGDERTPVGIYFTTHRYQDNKVTIFGDRAIHLNFPNPFDQAAGRQGNGIYIHGTNQKLRPRSSNGCIVLRNQDLAILADLISEQQTPVIVVEQLRFADKEKRIEACKTLTSLEAMGESLVNAPQGQVLALKAPSGPPPQWLASVAPRLGGLDPRRDRKMKIVNTGQILLGLGDQWVLVVGQDLKVVKRKTMPMLRRFYFEGPPDATALMKDHWIVPNELGAKHLASLAPKMAPKPKPKPKPAVLAKAEPAPAPKPAKAERPAPDPQAGEKQVLAMVAGWLKAWQSKNLRGYMRYYAPDFQAEGKNRKQWGRHKAYLNRVYKIIRVKAEDLKVSIDGNKAKVSFVQHYRSDWHRDSGLKTLELVKQRGRWKIVGETWQELPNGRSQAANRGGAS